MEIISDEGEKTLSVIRWTTSRAYLKSSDKIGFAESAPITSEIELNIEMNRINTFKMNWNEPLWRIAQLIVMF